MTASADPQPENEVVIRRLLPSDAKDAADLSAELGYPIPVDAMQARLKQFAEMEDHAVFAACVRDRVVAWIDVGIVHHLQSPTYGEIGGFIVSRSHQGRGIGKRLVKTAEEWTMSRRATKILVRSQIAREAAQAFYLGRNFVRVKTSDVFMKSIE